MPVFLIWQIPTAVLLFGLCWILVFLASFGICKMFNGNALDTYKSERSIIGVVSNPGMTDADRIATAKGLLAYNKAATTEGTPPPLNASQVRIFTQVAASGKAPAPLTPPKLKRPNKTAAWLLGWILWSLTMPWYLGMRRKTFLYEIQEEPWLVRTLFWAIVLPRWPLFRFGRFIEETPSEATGPE